jgi:hypothetical protein
MLVELVFLIHFQVQRSFMQVVAVVAMDQMMVQQLQAELAVQAAVEQAVKATAVLVTLQTELLEQSI